MKNILILLLISGIMVNANFIRSGDIVTDSITGLQWQDNSKVKTIRLDWEEAINYCEDLNFMGYNDWRLPNINELLSIVDDTKYNPAIDSIFIYTALEYYWSSTTLPHDKRYGWHIDFIDGTNDEIYSAAKWSSAYVRCVRAGE